MTGSYKRFDQINPSLFDSLIRTSREDDQPKGTDFVPMGLMAPDTSTRQPSISPDAGEVSTSDNILTRSAAAMGAFSTDPDLVASTVVPQPRMPEEVDLSEWESMPPVRDFIGPSQTEQAIPTLPSSMGMTAPVLPQITADEYVPATLVLADQPASIEAPDIVRVSQDQYDDYTTTTSAGSRNVSDIEGILFHYVHGPNPEGSSLSSYMNSGFYGWDEERGSYRNGPGEGKGAPFYIARDGTIYEVGDWRNNAIQHVSSSARRVVPDAPRTPQGERFRNTNSIGIEIDVGWNYNDGTQYGSQYEGEAGRPTEAQIESLNRLTNYLINEVNSSREDNPLTIESSVFAHPELQRDKMPVEGMLALERIRGMAGLVPRRAGETGVFVSPVPQPRPTSEGSSKQTTEKGEAGKQTTARQVVNSSFIESFVNEMEALEGLEGDKVLGETQPTYAYGITEERANSYGMKPSDYSSMREFAEAFSERYINEMEDRYSDIFNTVSEQDRLALHSYLFNAGSFYPGQLRALNAGDMRGFIHEMRDVVNTDNKEFAVTGLSKRRAAEANLLGRNVDGWTPIAEVRASGTTDRPVFEWLDAEGNVIERHESTVPLHSTSELGTLRVPQFN